MGYTSFNRLRAGIESPQYTISAPVVPQAIDLRNLTRPQRGKAVAAGGNRIASPLAGLGDITTAVIASAKGSRTPQQRQGSRQQRQQNQAEQARPQQPNPAQAHVDAAEATSATGSQRHGISFSPDSQYSAAGTTVTSTAATRPADGPLGSAGEPAGGFLTGTPSTFDSIGSMF